MGHRCGTPMGSGSNGPLGHLPDPITSPYAAWARDALEVTYDQYNVRKDYDKRAV